MSHVSIESVEAVLGRIPGAAAGESGECAEEHRPRTDAGKERSAQNAITHGIFCMDAVLPGERTGDFVAFRNLLFSSLKPQDWLECSICDQYVLARWRMRRAQGAERVVHERVGARLIDDVLADIGEVNFPRDYEGKEGPGSTRHDRHWWRRHRRGLMHVVRAAGTRAGADTRVDATMAATFCDRDDDGEPRGDHGAFERVGRYLHRLETTAHRALAELRQWRKDRGVDVSQLPDCPFIEEIPDDEDDADPPTASTDDEHEWNDEEDDDAPEETKKETEREKHEQENDAGASPPGGVVTSDFDALSRVVTLSGEQQAPVQNEPNSSVTVAGDGADEGCDEASCNIEIIAPMKLATREVDEEARGADEAAREGKEDANRT